MVVATIPRVPISRTGRIDTLKKRILIAEDEQALLYSMKVLIEQIDDEFEVYSANNGRQALELINGLDIDLLITDIKMPEMDGLELIREVQKKYPSIKILAMSGIGDQYLKAAKSFGASYVFNKPFEIDELTSAINKVLS